MGLEKIDFKELNAKLMAQSEADARNYMQNPLTDREIDALIDGLSGTAKTENIDNVVFETKPAKAEEPEKEYAAQRDALNAKLQTAAKELEDFIKNSEPINLEELNALISKYTGENLKKFVLDGITDEKLKKEAERFVKELDKADPGKYETMKTSGIKENIKNIYKNVRDLHVAQVAIYLENNPTNNISAGLETIQQGFYYSNRIEKDSEEGKEIAAKIESGELTGKEVKQTEDGSYYRIIPIGHQYASSSKFEKYALEAYKHDIVPREMATRMLIALDELEKSGELENYKTDAELVAAIKEKAGVKNGSDYEFEKFIKKNTNISEIFARKQKVMKRREELKHVTWEYICDNLSQEVIYAMKDYINQHQRRDEDGKLLNDYDLSELSEIIEERSGKDFFVNTHEDIELNELESIRKGFVGPKNAPVKKPELFDPYDKSNPKFKMTKELVEFCGYEVQKRNHMPTLLEGALGLVNGGVSTAVGFMTAVPKTRLIIYNHVLDVNQTVITNTPDATVIVQNIVNKIIHKEIPINEWENLCCAIRNGSLTGLAVAMIADAIIGRPVNEESCIGVELDFDSSDESYNNPDNYKDYLRRTGRLDDTENNRIDAAVEASKKPGETRPWHEIYRNTNVSDSGHGLLNCEERIMSKIPDKKPEIAEPAKPRIITVEKHTPEQKEKIEYVLVERQIVQGSSWAKIADEAYNCGDRTLKDLFPSLRDRITVIKLSLCITDGNYSEKRMRDLLKIVRDNKGSALRKALENEPGFDVNAFLGHGDVKGFYNGNRFPTEKVMENGKLVEREVLYLPKNIAEIDKCKDLSRETLKASGMTQAQTRDEVTSSSMRKGELEIVTQKEGTETRIYNLGTGEEEVFTNDSEGASKRIEAIESENGIKVEKQNTEDEYKKIIDESKTQK